MSADGVRLRKLFERAGVTHGVTFSIEACYGGVDLGNSYTLEQVSAQAKLSAMIVAHPDHPQSSRRWIAEAANNPKIVGVKLHPALGNYDVLGTGVMRLLEDDIGPSGLPVLSHVGNDSQNVTIDKYLKLASRFPAIRFVAAHLGIGVLGPADTAVNAWIENPQPNVWFDMGTLRAFCSGSVEHLLSVVGPDRICFGTDAPLYDPAPFVRMLEVLDVTEEVREKIAYRNILAVIPSLAAHIDHPA
jgi:predicted TIM-barrel fold metal-dependent hydrolase